MQPSYEERDRFLDELASAYAQGRVDDSQFARRSEQILTSETREDLERALAGLRINPRPYEPASGQVAHVAQPYQPQPPPLYGPQPKTRRVGRRSMFLVGGSVAFVGVVSVAMAGSLLRNNDPVPYSGGAMYTPDATPTVSNYLDGNFHGPLDRYLTGAISQVILTQSSVVAWAKPLGKPWARITIDTAGTVSTEPTDDGSNIFDATEANVFVVSEVVQTSSEKVGAVKSVEFVRPSAKLPVRIVVTGVGGGQVIWDALNRVIIEVKPAK